MCETKKQKYAIKKIDDSTIIIFNLTDYNKFSESDAHEICDILSYMDLDVNCNVYINNLRNENCGYLYVVKTIRDLLWFKEAPAPIATNIIKESNMWWAANAWLIKNEFTSFIICYGDIF